MPSTPSGRPPAPASPRPALLALACALVLLEAAGLVVAAVVGVVALFSGDDLGPVVALVLFALGAAALLAAAARGLWAGRRWGRAPVLTAQIMVVVSATTWWGLGAGALALPPILVAAVVAVALLSPSVVAATLRRGSGPDASADA